MTREPNLASSRRLTELSICNIIPRTNKVLTLKSDNLGLSWIPTSPSGHRSPTVLPAPGVMLLVGSHESRAFAPDGPRPSPSRTHSSEVRPSALLLPCSDPRPNGDPQPDTAALAGESGEGRFGAWGRGRGLQTVLSVALPSAGCPGGPRVRWHLPHLQVMLTLQDEWVSGEDPILC